MVKVSLLFRSRAAFTHQITAISLRYPHIFVTSQETGLELKQKVESLIDTSLKQQNTQKLLHSHHSATKRRFPDNKHNKKRGAFKKHKFENKKDKKHRQ